MLTYSILSDCITLLYRESLLEDKTPTMSGDMIKRLLALSRTDATKAVLGGESDYLDELTMLVEDMIDSPSTYDKNTLIDKLMLIHTGRMDLFKPLETIINKELTQGELKRSLSSLSKNINEYMTKYETKLVIKNAYKDVIIKNPDVKQTQTLIKNLIAALDTLVKVKTGDDPAVVDEVDLVSVSSLNKITERVKDRNDSVGLLKTGWGTLNRILQGGFRRGETWVVCALQHNYKSGFLQSLVAQFARFNTPVLTNPDKKPLIVYISFEDNADIYVEFLHRYIYTNNNDHTLPDMKTLTPNDIATYIKEDLGKNGYNIKTLRINPDQWTYMDMFNKILEYESEGYEVHACIIDYLAKLPTTGCIKDGPGGTDVRDLFQKVRTFFSVKNICCITAHQLSTEAKQIIRSDIREDDFVKMIAGKGYTELSKQIDQIVDGELYLHIAKVKKDKWLTMMRGKHRVPTLISDEDKYGKLKFQPGIPLQENPEDVKDDGSTDQDGFSDLLNLIS